MVNKRLINKWTFDEKVNEIAFYNESKKGLRELAKMPFYEGEYNALPQDDKECFNYLYEKYKRHYKYEMKQKRENAFLQKEFNRQRKYIKPTQYYIDNAICTLNGECYRDETAYETGKGICYISEYALKELQEGKPLMECMCTRNTIKRDCKMYGSGKVNPDFIFETIDWQEPCSLIYELE